MPPVDRANADPAKTREKTRDRQRKRRGRDAEDLAVGLLRARGYQILHRNWQRPEGELDIVALDEGTCVFVEVRSRTGDERGHPLEMVTPSKQRQVIRTARIFLAEEGERTPATGYRFDVVGVRFDPDGKDQPACIHIEDAFTVA